MVVSMIARNRKRVRMLGCNPAFLEKLDWNSSDLSKFKYSLYLEDDFTHDNYNHLGDRFYEAVYSNTVNLFDNSCLKTLKKSKYNNYESFMIEELKDIKEKNFDELLQIQNEEWKPIILKEKKTEEEKLINIFNNL